MSFSEEVGQFFALTAAQSAQLEAGLIALEQAFQQAESDVVNMPAFASRFYQKFQQLIRAFAGLMKIMWKLFWSIYMQRKDTVNLVTYIVPSYYAAGGDRKVFEELYQGNVK